MFPIYTRDHPYFQVEMEGVSNYLIYGDEKYMYVVVANDCRNLVFYLTYITHHYTVNGSL